MAEAARDLDVLRSYNESPTRFCDIFKENGLSPAGMSLKGVTSVIDAVIKKRVYKLLGNSPFSCSLTIPAEGSR